MSLAIRRLSLQRLLAQVALPQKPSIRSAIEQIHTSAQLNSFKSWYRSKWIPRRLEPPYTHIVQIGDPVLRQKSAALPVDAIKSKEVNFFIDQLIDVLHGYKLAGIAAPQVGMALKIIVMEFGDELKKEFTAEEYRVREMEKLPLTVKW